MIISSAVAEIAGSSFAESTGEQPLYVCNPEVHVVHEAFEMASLPRGRVSDFG